MFFLIFTILLIVLRIPILYKYGNLPLKQNINYQLGYLHIKPLRNGSYYIAITDKVSNQIVEYSCMYSPYEISKFSSCFSKDIINQYIGKQALIGWYQEKSSTGIINPYRQLVSLQVDGLEVRKYEDTLNQISKDKTAFKIIFIPVGLIIIFTIYLIFLGLRAAYLSEKGEINVTTQ